MEPINLAEKIIQSVFFKRAKDKAQTYTRDRRKLSDLLQTVIDKASQLGNEKEGHLSFLSQVALLVRMVKACVSGEYKDVPWRSLVLVVATLIYFVSPLDFIPDLLPFVGLTDDIALVWWVVKMLQEDIQKYRAWELDRGTSVIELISLKR